MSDVENVEVNLRNQITRINCEPEFYTYNETHGLCIQWQVSDVRMISKIIEGPINTRYEENGKVRRKQRFKVMMIPEMEYNPSDYIIDLIDSNEKTEEFNSLVTKHRPSLDVMEKMEAKASELHYREKLKNGGNNSTVANGYSSFKVGELGEGKMMKEIEEAIPKCSFRVWKRLVKKLPEQFKGITVEPSVPRPPNFRNNDVRKCLRIVGGKSDEYYVAKYWPWFLFATDLKKPFWKLMHNVLGYNKITITTTVYDLDVEDFLKLRKMRQDFYEMKELIRVVKPVERGL